MILSTAVTQSILRNLVAGNDYRGDIVHLIDAEFLGFAVDFFKKVVIAKMENKTVTADWYKDEFLNERLPKEEIAINSGLNMKTITNMHNSGTKRVVIDASHEHYDMLYETIRLLSDSEDDFDLELTLKFKKASVDLSIGETLVVINTLAVKRAAIRGGFWSAAGKRVEKPLMQLLCGLYGVPRENYEIHTKADSGRGDAFTREVDFYLVDGASRYKCEVKLMGKGNPESADAVIARDSRVFVADKLSETNKAQLDSLGVEWVELRAANGFRRFETVLHNLGIPRQSLNVENLNQKIEELLAEIFQT